MFTKNIKKMFKKIKDILEAIWDEIYGTSFFTCILLIIAVTLIILAFKYFTNWYYRDVSIEEIPIWIKFLGGN